MSYEDDEEFGVDPDEGEDVVSEAAQEAIRRTLEDLGEDPKVAEGPRIMPSLTAECAREITMLYWRGEAERRYWRGGFYRHLDSHWGREEMADVRLHVNNDILLDAYKKVKPVNGKKMNPAPWNPTPASLAAVMDQLALQVGLPSTREPDTSPDGTPGWIAFENQWFHCITGVGVPHSKDVFNTYAVPFPFDSKAECPQWREFLHTVFSGDQAAIDTQMYWIAYLLSGSTHLQKGYLLTGPTRTGKSVIDKVTAHLMGVAGTQGDMDHITEMFALNQMLGKNWVMFSDLREIPKNGVGRLLQLVANDPLVVGKKNRDDWVGSLGVRLQIHANHVPNFHDPTGALPKRWVMNRTTGPQFMDGVAGKDEYLHTKLMAEAAGIINWAMDYVSDLFEPGFQWPETLASIEDHEMAMAESSPVRTWLEESRDIEVCHPAEGEILKSEAFSDFLSWVHQNNYDKRGYNSVTFGKELLQLNIGVKSGQLKASVDSKRPYIYRGLRKAEEG